MDLSAINPVLLIASLMVAATPLLLAGIGELVVEKSGVLIGGVPVELRTAIMWENLGLLPPGTVSGAAASEGYVPLSPENAIPVSEQELEDFRIEDPNRAQDVSLR